MHFQAPTGCNGALRAGALGAHPVRLHFNTRICRSYREEGGSLRGADMQQLSA